VKFEHVASQNKSKEELRGQVRCLQEKALYATNKKSAAEIRSHFDI